VKKGEKGKGGEGREREGGEGREEEGREGKGRGEEYRHFFLYTLSTAYAATSKDMCNVRNKIGNGCDI